MKKILIVSDTHGYNEALWQVINKEEPFDMLVHCGDFENNPSILETKVDCDVHMVSGNNDWGGGLSRTQVFNIGHHKVVLVHGHRYRLWEDLSSLVYLARENEADIVMFGHLHLPIVQTMDGVTLINPGSLTYPRQANHVPTYIIMTVDDKGDATYEIKYCGHDEQ